MLNHLMVITARSLCKETLYNVLEQNAGQPDCIVGSADSAPSSLIERKGLGERVYGFE